MKRALSLLMLAFLSLTAADKKNPRAGEIPKGGNLNPKEEIPVFVVSSKHGMRIMISKDDGQSWQESFLGTSDQNTGGGHGPWAVNGLTLTNGIIGAYSGWGASGTYLGSDDGKKWSHLSSGEVEMKSVFGAAGGQGVMIAGADQWRGFSISSENGANWKTIKPGNIEGFKENGGKTHHLKCGYGAYGKGTFVVVGDHGHVFYSNDLGESWKHSMIPKEALSKNPHFAGRGVGHKEVVFLDGAFLVLYDEQVALSKDGGKTWKLVKHGLKSISSVTLVNNEFWITSRSSKAVGRKSKDGENWEDLPQSIPAGKICQSAKGTLINISRKTSKIQRSTDGGKSWKTVYENTGAKDTTKLWGYAVHGKIKK